MRMNSPWARSGRCATWAWWWRGIRRSPLRLSPPPRPRRSAADTKRRRGRPQDRRARRQKLNMGKRASRWRVYLTAIGRTHRRRRRRQQRTGSNSIRGRIGDRRRIAWRNLVPGPVSASLGCSVSWKRVVESSCGEGKRRGREMNDF